MRLRIDADRARDNFGSLLAALIGELNRDIDRGREFSPLASNRKLCAYFEFMLKGALDDKTTQSSSLALSFAISQTERKLCYSTQKAIGFHKLFVEPVCALAVAPAIHASTPQSKYNRSPSPAHCAGPGLATEL